jgi:hypothetical protein
VTYSRKREPSHAASRDPKTHTVKEAVLRCGLDASCSGGCLHIHTDIYWLMLLHDAVVTNRRFESCYLLGCHAAQSGKILTDVSGQPSVPSSSIKKSKLFNFLSFLGLPYPLRWHREVVPKRQLGFTTLRCVTSHKSVGLIHIAA